MKIPTPVGLLLSSTLFISTLKAQEAAPVLALTHYKFVHVNDTAQREKKHTEEMVLYIGKEASLYTTYSDKIIEQQLDQQMRAPGFDGNITLTGSSRTTKASYYFRPKDEIYSELYKIGSVQYRLDDTFPQLEWKLMAQTKTIGGYTCQRAETYFKGRDYSVWFSPDLPFPYGPWKLQGLPGLILEAKDSKDEVVFLFEGFDKISSDSLLLNMPEQTARMSREVIAKLEAAFKKDPNVAMAAISKGKGNVQTKPLVSATSPAISDPLTDPSRIKSIHVQKTMDTDKVSEVTNNPLEIED